MIKKIKNLMFISMFRLRLYETDYLLEQKLEVFFKSPIVDIVYKDDEVRYIQFINVNQDVLEIWNYNFPTSWASRGTLNGYRWSNKMPSVKSLNRLHGEIIKFYSTDRISFEMTRKMINASLVGDYQLEAEIAAKIANKTILSDKIVNDLKIKNYET